MHLKQYDDAAEVRRFQSERVEIGRVEAAQAAQEAYSAANGMDQQSLDGVEGATGL